MSTYFALGTVLEAGDRAENEKDKGSCPCPLSMLVRETELQEAASSGEKWAGAGATREASQGNRVWTVRLGPDHKPGGRKPQG